MFEILLVICAVLLCVFLTVRRRNKGKPPPGPAGCPFCANSFQLDADNAHHTLTELADEYGPIFRLRVFGTNVTTLTSLRYILTALDQHPGCEYANDRPNNSSATVFYGRKHIGLANLNKQTYGLRAFHIHGIQTYCDGKEVFEVKFRQEVERLHMSLICKPGFDVNPLNNIKTFYWNICSLLLLGDVIPESHPDREIPWQFVENVFLLLQPSVDGPLKTFPFLRRLPGYYGNIYSQTIETRDKVAKMYFEDHKASYVHGKIRGLVDVCLKTQQDEISATGSTWLTDEYIKGLVFDTLSAGMTEMTKTLRLFVLLMCHYPDCQTRIQAEIDAVIGTEVHPSVATIGDMPYTEAVIFEVLRYGSQTQLGIPHLCRKDIAVDGYLIEKGSLIFPNLYGIHHDEKIWGDPWEFRPGRFLDRSGRLLPSDHVFIQNLVPFSVGKRACPGQDFARTRVFLGVTSLLQRMRILSPAHSDLPSADPRLYTKNYPLYEPEFNCKIVCRENYESLMCSMH